MKYRITNVWSIVFYILLLSACKESSRDSWLPSAAGASGEVILVLEDELWADTTGSIFKSILAYNYTVLPQEEPCFDLVQIPERAFKNLFEQQRNIIRTKISPSIQEAKITIQENVWATPQVYIVVAAPTVTQLNDLLWKNKDKLFQFLTTTENKRILETYKKFADKDMMQRIKDKHKLELVIPKGFTLTQKTDNFLWLSRETNDIEQGILIYYYPYQDTAMFGTKRLIEVRDSLLKLNVPISSSVESYMITEKRYSEIERNVFQLAGNYTVELRGLWRAEPRYIGMGGPFVSLSSVDESLNRIITIEGFVYAPSKKKRKYLRQVKSMIYSLRFGNNIE